MSAPGLGTLEGIRRPDTGYPVQQAHFPTLLALQLSQQPIEMSFPRRARRRAAPRLRSHTQRGGSSELTWRWPGGAKFTTPKLLSAVEPTVPMISLGEPS